MWKGYTLILIIFLLIFPGVKAEDKVKVAVSISDFASILKEIGGNEVEIHYILPPYTDPHSFSLTREKIEEIKRADLVILANSELLSYEKKIKELYASNYVDFPDYEKNGAKLLSFGDYNKNPHGYWLYAENAIAIAKTIAIKLQEITGKDIYMERFVEFKRRVMNEVNCTVNESIVSGIYGKKVIAAVPGVCYIPANYGIWVDEVIASEGSATIGAREVEKIERKLKEGEYDGIIIPDFMKNSKVGEIASIIAHDTGSRIIYVKFVSNESYESVFLHNFIQFIQPVEIQESKYSNELIIMCIALSIFAIFEGGIIYVMRRR